MHEILKKIYRAIIKRLPTKIVLNIENLRGYKRPLKKKRIEYFGEKIQWMKMYGGLEKYSNLVDKYVVREYVKNKVGEKYLTNIIKVYDSTSEIDFDKLPEKFVLKLNTGSGYNIICKDKEKLNREKTIKQLNKWLKEDYTKIKKEPQYKNINKKIICEEYMESKDGNLFDYKLFCFKGKVEFIEVDFDRFENHAMNFYNRNWKLLDLKKGKYPNYSGELKKPDNLSEMIEVAERLSDELQFARIDLYDVDGKIYFGEITLTPAGGLTPFTPIEKDREIAKLLDLPMKNQILYIGSVGEKSGRLDGVTIKSRCLLEYLKKCNINLKFIDVDGYKKRFVNIITKILVNYKKSDVIVICSSSPGASIIIRFLEKIKTKKKVIYFVCGGVLGQYIKENKYKHKWYRFIDKIYVESEEMKIQFEELGFSQVEKLNNFRNPKVNYVEVTENKGITKLVFFGRVIKEKGIEEAIKLVKELSNNNVNVSLDIYGQVDKQYLEVLMQLTGENKNIEYKGAINPNGKIEYEKLHKYDIFIFPTHYYGEGLPGALIDAYISGLAVAVSNWKYAFEYVNNGENGIIFEINNYEDMYEKVKDMIQSGKVQEYKKMSLKLANEYKIDNILIDFKNKLNKKT